MTSFVFNTVKGSVGSYLDLVPANSALVVIPIESAGLETKSVLEDKTSLSDVLSGSTNEQTSLGRKVSTAVTTGVDNSLNRYSASIDEQTWVSGTGNPIGGIMVCYDPDTTTSTDADLIPITFHDWPITPSGSDITIYLANFYVSV